MKTLSQTRRCPESSHRRGAMQRSGRSLLLQPFRHTRVMQSARSLLVRRSTYCSSSGVIAALWPEGLLQESGGKSPTSIQPNLAEELLFEVGWQARHACIDVRAAEDFAHGRVRGAHSVPYAPASTFEERAMAALAKIHREQPAAQHLARASLPRGEGGDGDGDDLGSAKLVRLIIGGDDTSSLAFTATKVLLDSGFKNVLTLAVGFEEWKKQGLPCESDLEEDDEFPDSTF